MEAWFFINRIFASSSLLFKCGIIYCQLSIDFSFFFDGGSGGGGGGGISLLNTGCTGGVGGTGGTGTAAGTGGGGGGGTFSFVCANAAAENKRNTTRNFKCEDFMIGKF